MFDIQLIEGVAEELIYEAQNPSNEIRFEALNSERPFGPIAKKIEEIIKSNEELSQTFKECKETDSHSYISNVSSYYQNLFLSLTEIIVTEAMEEITPEKIEELVLSILRLRGQNICELLTQLLERQKLSANTTEGDTDSTSTVNTADQILIHRTDSLASDESIASNYESDNQMD